MAKKKTYRKTIRIDGLVIQERFSTKDDAEEWYTKMRQQKLRAKAGLEIEFEPQEFEVVCANFICSREHLETWRHDKYRLEHYFIPLFFGRMIHSISRKEWKEALEKLISVHGLKPKTYNNIRTLLSGLYDYAIKDEPRRAQHNPIKEIKQLPVMQEEIEFFHTAEECQKYLVYAQKRSPMYGMFAMIALNTGMRKGEIIGLRNDSVDLERKTIKIERIWSHSQRVVVKRTKGKRERILGINDTLLEAFKRHKEWSPFKGPEDYIVCNRKGAPMDTKVLFDAHHAVLKEAELSEIVIHGLRHTFATQYLANGGHIWDLKNILGHRSIKTTEKYAHVIPIKMQSRANVFEVGV